MFRLRLPKAGIVFSLCALQLKWNEPDEEELVKFMCGTNGFK